MQIKKQENFSEWYNSIIKDAELCDLRYNLKGFVVFMPWSVMTMKKMYKFYEAELEKNSHVPALFPALIPESYLKSESNHVAGFVPEVMWVTEAGSEKLTEKYAMRPTSETAMYPMYALWINGKSDLPLKIYQSCQVWRHETKATKPFIRSREFHWIEAHDVFATYDEALAQVHQDMQMAENMIHKKYGIPFIFFRRPQWDKFAGAVDTYAADTLMPDGKTLQLPSTHMLGQNFSKAFNIKFTDDDGQSKYAWQTTYGPAISRIYAALIATHGDDKGLILPFDLAPTQIVIVPIWKGENKELVTKECEKIRFELADKFSVKLDSTDNTPGFKFNHWESKGVPIRLELGERDINEGVCILVRRDNREKTKVKFSDLEKKIIEISEKFDCSIKEKADSFFANLLSSAKDIKELNKILEEKGGFVCVPFCTDQMEGKACAEKVKEQTHGNMRGSMFGNEEKPSAKEICIACGKNANVYLYVARQY
ncbi:MAG: proline--tRNA ligase [Candidatus Micrarchaeota archaeon]